jgi:hypothetical protein
MSETLRRVDRQQADGTWQTCRLADIRKRDVFRMWEPPDWTPVVMECGAGMQVTVFRAARDAFEGTYNGGKEGELRIMVDADPVIPEEEL